ncbi:MAG TPA: molybdopterin-dependent oxidoreductase [Spirochaetia bacterium]|nr:molybdopterin-dependent oxidoreductase [Spirochaetia bacterium]
MIQEKEQYFVHDYEEEGLLYAQLVRAPISRGLITTIHLPDLPDDVTVLTGGDIPCGPSVTIHGTRIPLLAEKEIHYDGEPLLVIAGPREAEVSEIVSQTRIICEAIYPILTFEGYTDEQVLSRKSLLQGNPSSMFLKADKIFESNYHVQAMRIPAHDPVGAFARWTGEKLEIVSSTLWPFEVRSVVCEALGMEPKDVVVQAAETSISFEKLMYPACYAALAGAICMKTKRPVQLIQSYEEGLRYAPKAAPAYVHIKTAVNEKGKLLASDIKIAVDVGASCIMAEELLNRIILSATGCYSCADVRIQGNLIMTNKPPMDGAKGIGSLQGFFASELQAGKVSAELCIDPLQFRQNNLIFSSRGKLLTGVLPKSGVNLPELLNRTAESSDFHRKYAAYELLKKNRQGIKSIYEPVRGIGITCAYQGCGLFGNEENENKSTVSVRLEKDGKLVIKTSWVPTNPGTYEVWIGIAQNILNIEKKNIIIERPHTGLCPDSGPSIFARNITIITGLIEQCLTNIQKKRFRTPLPLEETKRFRKIGSEQWDDNNFSGFPFPGMSWGACVIEVEFDPVSLETNVRGVWMTIDCGRIFCKSEARRTLESGVLTALTLSSRRTALSGSMEKQKRRYLPADISLAPPISIEFLESERSIPAGIDELPHNLVPAGYVAALSQACGIQFNSLPLTPDVIQRSLEVL